MGEMMAASLMSLTSSSELLWMKSMVVDQAWRAALLDKLHQAECSAVPGEWEREEMPALRSRGAGDSYESLLESGSVELGERGRPGHGQTLEPKTWFDNGLGHATELLTSLSLPP